MRKLFIIIGVICFGILYLSLPLLTQICIETYTADSEYCISLGKLRFPYPIETDGVWNHVDDKWK